MNKAAEIKKVDEIKSKLTEGSKGNPLNKIKRVYDTWVTCKDCSDSTILSNITYAYLCTKCGKFNNTKEAKRLFESGIQNLPESKYSKTVEMPAVQTMDSQKTEYRQLRDESEIRAEMFVNGQTRDSMGVDKFNGTLKKALVKEKAYRGSKTGIA